jgi:hypothetical protein
MAPLKQPQNYPREVSECERSKSVHEKMHEKGFGIYFFNFQSIKITKIHFSKAPQLNSCGGPTSPFLHTRALMGKDKGVADAIKLSISNHIRSPPHTEKIFSSTTNTQKVIMIIITHQKPIRWIFIHSVKVISLPKRLLYRNIAAAVALPFIVYSSDIYLFFSFQMKTTLRCCFVAPFLLVFSSLV